MPVLPTYDSNRNITARTPAVERQGSQQFTESLKQPLDTAMQITQDWAKAVDTMQLTQAKTLFQTKSAEIYSRASLDPDFNNAQSYMDELSKAKEESLQGFTNKEVAQRFALDVEADQQLESIKIDHLFKSKQLAFGINELKNGVTAMERNAILAGGTEVDKLLNDINGLIDLNVAGKIISPDDAVNLKKNAEANIKEGKIQNMIWADPEEAKKAIKESDQLTGEEKTKYEKQCNTLIT